MGRREHPDESPEIAGGLGRDEREYFRLTQDSAPSYNKRLVSGQKGPDKVDNKGSAFLEW